MNVLAIGDTHGNTSAICNVAIPLALKNNCKIVVQCGDFGYWEHEPHGVQFLDKVSKHLVRNDLDLFWLDGNHENHPKLWAEYAPSTPEGLCSIRPNLYYVPRGTVFKLGHVKCLGLGGAYSIDKDWRIREEAISGEYETLWWPTEMIRSEDVETAIANVQSDGPVDVMFTHDAPIGVDVPGIHSSDKWRFPETWTNRELLRQVFDVAMPKLLVHGHYHVRYTDMINLPPKSTLWEYCRVDGLANDGLWGFAVVLDLDRLFVSDW